MERDRLCPFHSKKLSHICVSPLCAERGRSACVICIKRLHKNCQDEHIFGLEEFYESSKASLQRDVAQFNNKREALKRPFIAVDARKAGDFQKETKEDSNSLERLVDENIREGLKKMQKKVFLLQKEAMKESNEFANMTLKNIDYLKKKCNIKLDKKKKKIILTPKNSNKVQEFLILHEFLRSHFERKFAASRAKLLSFKRSSPKFKVDCFKHSKLLNAEFSAKHNTLKIKSKKNSLWRNKNGKMNQLLLLTKPIQSALVEVGIRNLNLASHNLEILILNQPSIDFWMKKLNDSNELFREIPSLAKADFDLRKSHKLAEFCREGREKDSLEMSVNGCRKIVESCSLMSRIDKNEKCFHVWKINTQPLICKNLVPTNKEKAPKKEEILTEKEDDDAEWEDISTDSSEEIESGHLSTLKVAQMTQPTERQALFLALLFFNEHVQVDLKFHDFCEEKPH